MVQNQDFKFYKKPLRKGNNHMHFFYCFTTYSERQQKAVMSREHNWSPGAPWNVTHGRYREQYPSQPPMERPLGWRHRPVFQDSTRAGTAPVGFRPFEERVVERAFSVPSSPMDPYSVRRAIIFNRDMGHEMYPRLPPFQRWLMPRHLGQRDRHVHMETDEMKLTKEEQEMALRKLRKQVYYPPTKIKGQEMSLHYREPNRDHNVMAKDKHRDEEGKSCAICLEDFEPREEVLLTPCNHMFHEDCIIPWVKDHGKCPVCRSALFETNRVNCPALHNRGRVLHTDQRGVFFNECNRGRVLHTDQRGVFFNEFLSLMHDMDEAFIRSF